MITGVALVFPKGRSEPQLIAAAEQTASLLGNTPVVLDLSSGVLHQHGRPVGRLDGGVAPEDERALRDAGKAILVSVAEGGVLKGTWDVTFR